MHFRRQCSLLSIFALINWNILSTECEYTIQDGNSCFCLKEETEKLRNPVHIEPTVVDGENVYILAEQIGVLYEYRPGSKNKLSTYIDLTDRVVSDPVIYEQRGLLGFALHPKFASNRKIYIYSIRSLNNKDYAVISEIQDRNVEQEKLLMYIEQLGRQRNGGQLLFGDDGYLYIFVGDGGPTDDKDIQAQNGKSLLGKVLRIDVDTTDVIDFRIQHYGIPEDNPSISGWRPEVYAIGTRNMWRCGKDSGDKQQQDRGRGRIFCGDLGSSVSDEIVLLKKGANYGWPYREGTHCYDKSLCQTISDNETLPLNEFRRELTNVSAVVSGPLYRGSLFPQMYGQLMYGDFALGNLFTLQENGADQTRSSWTSHPFPKCDKSRCPCDARATQGTMLLSFGQTHDGEIMVLMTDEPNPGKYAGALFRLQPPLVDPATCGAPLTTSIYTTVLILSVIFSCLFPYLLEVNIKR